VASDSTFAFIHCFSGAIKETVCDSPHLLLTSARRPPVLTLSDRAAGNPSETRDLGAMGGLIPV